MKKNSFLAGSIFAVLSLLIVKALGILYVIPFYSIVGVSGATLYSYAYNVYAIFLNISSAGIPVGISKLISEFKTKGDIESIKKTTRISTIFVIIISAISFLALMIFAEPISKLIIGDKVGGSIWMV